MKQVMYIDFSLDYDGKCECINTFEVNGEDKTEDINEVDVDSFVEVLIGTIDDFWYSDHRTEIQVSWFDNGKMKINYRSFNEPEDGEFDDYVIKRDSIPLLYGEEE